jgi:hypothetical protein
VDTSAIWKFGTGHQLVGRSYDGAAKQDGFNLNVVKVQLEKPLKAEDNWAAGYNVGLLYGPDANTLATTSSLGRWANRSDFAIKNAYVAVRLPVHNGLDLKMGVWDSLVGYEVFEAGNNPNYSRSFAYAIEPKQHTGLLASFRVSDMLSLSAGIANGGGLQMTTSGARYNVTFDNKINKRSTVESLKSYMGSVTLTAPESLGAFKGATLYAGIVNTPVSARDDNFAGAAPDVVNYYVGATLPLGIEGLSLGACYDYRGSSKDKAANIHSTWANAVSGYLCYQATEKLKFCNRLEYATGSDGTWYFNPKHAEKNQLLGETITVEYDLWANVVSRLELRWDHDLRGDGIFNDGTDRNALSLALNLIYKF